MLKTVPQRCRRPKSASHLTGESQTRNHIPKSGHFQPRPKFAFFFSQLMPVAQAPIPARSKSLSPPTKTAHHPHRRADCRPIPALGRTEREAQDGSTPRPSSLSHGRQEKKWKLEISAPPNRREVAKKRRNKNVEWSYFVAGDAQCWRARHFGTCRARFPSALLRSAEWWALGVAALAGGGTRVEGAGGTGHSWLCATAAVQNVLNFNQNYTFCELALRIMG